MSDHEELVYSTLVQEDPSFADLVEECIVELPAYVEELAAAIARNDAPVVARIGHTVKGAAGSHGFLPVSEIAAAIERHARAGNLAPAKEELGRLRELLPRLRAVPQEQP
jgi:HPt (histidine-containing phosphotransfer) domain-containing protein